MWPLNIIDFLWAMHRHREVWMPDGNLDYTTPITDDVLGYLSEAEANKVLSDIEALPAPST